jgi:hypothetical protein
VIAISFVLAAALAEPTPGPTASPLPAPSASAMPAASASVPPPSGTPAATTAPEAYKYRFVPHQPSHPDAGTPQIFAVYLNDQTLHSQGPIQIKVTTSPNVVKVVTENGSRQGVIPQIVPGDFETNSKLPKVPFIASGMTLFLKFDATTADGASVTVRVPVKLL